MFGIAHVASIHFPAICGAFEPFSNSNFGSGNRFDSLAPASQPCHPLSGNCPLTQLHAAPIDRRRQNPLIGPDNVLFHQPSTNFSSTQLKHATLSPLPKTLNSIKHISENLRQNPADDTFNLLVANDYEEPTKLQQKHYSSF